MPDKSKPRPDQGATPTEHPRDHETLRRESTRDPILAHGEHALSEGARDTRDHFTAGPPKRGVYPRTVRRAVADKRWERASWLEARHAERWLARLVAPDETAADERDTWLRARMQAYVEGAELTREEGDGGCIWDRASMAEWISIDVFDDEQPDHVSKAYAACSRVGWPPGACDEHDDERARASA